MSDPVVKNPISTAPLAAPVSIKPYPQYGDSVSYLRCENSLPVVGSGGGLYDTFEVGDTPRIQKGSVKKVKSMMFGAHGVTVTFNDGEQRLRTILIHHANITYSSPDKLAVE